MAGTFKRNKLSKIYSLGSVWTLSQDYTYRRLNAQFQYKNQLF